METWLILVLLVIFMVLLMICAVYFILRRYYPSYLSAFFTIGEEKEALTHGNHTNLTYTIPNAKEATSKRDEEAEENLCDEDLKQRRNSPGSDNEAAAAVAANLTRSSSVESLASDTSVMDLQPDLSPIGQLEIGLEYDEQMNQFVMCVIQARDLAAEAEQFDYYINIYLVPDVVGDMKTQTKIVRRTNNPVFEERFLYTIKPHDLANKSFQFHVLSVDKQARHKQVGETDVRLADLDLHRPLRLWFNLREIDQKPSCFGELMFSLSYLPTAERLTVVIVKAKNLKWFHEDQLCGDVFVKLHMIVSGQRVAKKKTSLKRGENQPTFNEAMIFSVPQSTLSNVQLRITVSQLQADRHAYSIGHVIIGSNTGGTELSHWQQMMSSLRKPVAMWHYLRKSK